MVIVVRAIWVELCFLNALMLFMYLFYYFSFNYLFIYLFLIVIVCVRHFVSAYVYFINLTYYTFCTKKIQIVYNVSAKKSSDKQKSIKGLT